MMALGMSVVANAINGDKIAGTEGAMLFLVSKTLTKIKKLSFRQENNE